MSTGIPIHLFTIRNITVTGAGNSLVNKHSILFELDMVLKITCIFCNCINSLFLWDILNIYTKRTHFISIYAFYHEV